MARVAVFLQERLNVFDEVNGASRGIWERSFLFRGQHGRPLAGRR
jgi:hypothetical protein